MIEIAKDRPPYVTFEVRAEEDRTKSLEAGHFVAKDVVYALVTPMGSKDRLERVASEWLDKLRQDTAEGRFPQEWLQHFVNAHKAFIEGNEAPLSGTAIANWPPVSPAQVKTLQGLHVRTVEDLAAANEEVLGRIGMGGRALKQRAIDWLASAKDVGKVGEEISAMRVANEDLARRNEELQTQLQELARQVAALTPAQPAAKSQKL